MKNPKLLIVISLLVLSTLAAVPATLPRANAQLIGTVCLAEAGSSGCPTSPPTLSASPGTQLTVSVNIQGSDPVVGFDIMIFTDATVLQAADADLTGSILGSGGASTSIVVECLDGNLISGSTCAPQDGIGVLHFAAARLGGLSPGNGLLFTAVYNVVAEATSITLGFQTGCSNTSVGPDTCVTISNGTLTPLPETAQGALFTTNPVTFTMSASPNSHTVNEGVTGSSTITLSSVGGFTDFIDLALFPSNGLNCALSSAGENLAPGGTASVTLSCSAAVDGSYSALVTGTGATTGRSQSVTVSYTVTQAPEPPGPPDFSLIAVPNAISIPRFLGGNHGSSVINLESVSDFSGTVNLAASLVGTTLDTYDPTCDATLDFTLSPTMFTLTPGGKASGSLDAFVIKQNCTGLYTATVTGTSGLLTHSVQVAIYVIDYVLELEHPSVTVINNPGPARIESVMSVTAVGAPSDEVNPGFLGTMLVPTGPGYGYSSAVGRPVPELGVNVCYFQVFDANGNLISPTVVGGQVTSFAAPIVHLQGDILGPENEPGIDGCRFTSTWFSAPSFTDFPVATARILSTTPSGSYTAKICLQSGSLVNCIDWHITVVDPPAAPAFNQFVWDKSPRADQTFKVGVNNPAGNPTLFVRVEITAVSSDGSITLTGVSNVFAIAPDSNRNNIPVTIDLSDVPPGVTFSFTARIVYGVDPFVQTVDSTQTIGATKKGTGAFVTE